MRTLKSLEDMLEQGPTGLQACVAICSTYVTMNHVVVPWMPDAHFLAPFLVSLLFAGAFVFLVRRKHTRKFYQLSIRVRDCLWFMCGGPYRTYR